MNKNITLLPVNEAEFCVIDIETTGLSPRYSNIIEIGMVKIAGGKIVSSYQSLVNPGRDIPYFITGLTGITNNDVYDAPFFEDIAPDISSFIGESVVTAHNLSFDKSFMKKEMELAGFSFLFYNLCTLKVSRRLLPMLKSRKLGSLCRHFHIKNSSEHRALEDAEVTAKILLKMLPQLKEEYNVETVGELLNFQYAPKTGKTGVPVKKSLASEVSLLPDAPGLYYFLNSRKEIIYIGKAKSLRQRIRTYFSPTAPAKAKKIVKQSSHIKIELTNSELTALLGEAELIKQEMPKHNRLLKTYGNKYFLRISSSEKFPRLELCNYFDFDGNDYFGLFISRKNAVTILDIIQKAFKVRECDEKEFSAGRGCFLSEIERCGAPCVSGDVAEYREELDKVYEFLYGKNQFAVTRLINRMKSYSEKLKFEKAAEVKELIDLILAQTYKSAIIAEPVNSAKVVFEISEGLMRDYILMLNGKVFIKKYALNENDSFNEALDDYFAGTINLQIMPDPEDLEKMKIMLSWLIRNRTKVRLFYLRKYSCKEEMFHELSGINTAFIPPPESSFNISSFLEEEKAYEVSSTPEG
jgi:DNA polymerase III subunit epsilon